MATWRATAWTVAVRRADRLTTVARPMPRDLGWTRRRRVTGNHPAPEAGATLPLLPAAAGSPVRPGAQLNR